jgi:hypothetical protein
LEPEGDTKGLEQEFEEQWSEGNPFVKECDLDKQEFVGNGLILQEQEFEGVRHRVESPLEEGDRQEFSDEIFGNGLTSKVVEYEDMRLVVDSLVEKGDKPELVAEFWSNGLTSQELEFEGLRLDVEPEGDTKGMNGDLQRPQLAGAGVRGRTAVCRVSPRARHQTGAHWRVRGARARGRAGVR